MFGTKIRIDIVREKELEKYSDTHALDSTQICLQVHEGLKERERERELISENREKTAHANRSSQETVLEVGYIV